MQSPYSSLENMNKGGYSNPMCLLPVKLLLLLSYFWKSQHRSGLFLFANSLWCVWSKLQIKNWSERRRWNKRDPNKHFDKAAGCIVTKGGGGRGFAQTSGRKEGWLRDWNCAIFSNWVWNKQTEKIQLFSLVNEWKHQWLFSLQIIKNWKENYQSLKDSVSRAGIFILLKL